MPDQETLPAAEPHVDAWSDTPSRSRLPLLHRGWSRRRTSVAALLALALVAGIVGLVTAAWWWRHPAVFREPASQATVGLGERRPVDEGPMHLGVVWPLEQPPGSAELRAAEPQVLVNTARARFDVRLCERRGRSTIYSFAGGLDRFCSRLSDVDGATLTWDEDGVGDSYLVMTIRPRRVGEVRVQGIDLTYTHGLQSGTQQVGDHVWFRYVAPREGRG